jgi:DNA excision repair protein ERCC-3
MPDHTNPLIVQSDFSLLLEVFNDKFETVRNGLTKFAELIKSPEHIHTYRLTSLSLWNAASIGLSYNEIIEFLNKYSKFEIPQNIIVEIDQIYKRFGLVEIHKSNNKNTLVLYVKDNHIEQEILSNPKLKKYLLDKKSDREYYFNELNRGNLKVDFFKYNIPVNDIAGYTNGDSLDFNIKSITLQGREFKIRDYQKMAGDSFYHAGSNIGGHGTIVLPCGSGKTIVGLYIMSMIKSYTLILTTSVAAVHQWINELLDKTTLTKDQIGEYTGDKKEIKPITICTYQILIYRKNKESDFLHFEIFHAQNWGLIIYDEVHLLPAPIFKITAGIQSKRRLGLTATLVREDGNEKDVFCLIGPKKYDTPWKVLEKQGWIAEARCFEIKLPLPEKLLMEYLISDQKLKYTISSKNPYKNIALKDLLFKHQGQLILIIGHFLDQLREVAMQYNAPLITGKSTNKERENTYKKFRDGEIKILVVSKVANFSIDLPDASVLIQLSGTYGSRQEEAQRLGRILRPKQNNISYFYSLVTKDTIEEQYSHKRQRFLTEQGYNYEIDFWDPQEFVWEK